MKQKLIGLSFLLFLLLSCTYRPQNYTILRIKGSDTMLKLVSSLAEEYMKKNTEVSIYVEGGGTGKGVEALIEGKTNICAASRTLTAYEARQVATNLGGLGMSFLIAKDALSIYINPENIKKDFTLEELKKIFSGSVTNWKQIGGTDELIVPVIRNPNSGTYLYFKQHLLDGEEYSERALTKPTTASVIKEILRNKNSIGYGGIGFDQGQFFASVGGTKPTEQNIIKNVYPIVRYLYFYTADKPRGESKKFIDWIMSSEGQRIIKQSGFVRIWDKSF